MTSSFAVLQNGAAFLRDLLFNEIPQLLGTFLNTGVGQNEGPLRGHVQIGGDGVPVDVMDILPLIAGLILLVADADAVGFFRQAKGVESPGTLESLRQDLLPQGREEAEEIDQRHTQSHDQQYTAQKNSAVHMVHDEADVGADAEDGCENSGGSPDLSAAQQVKHCEFSEDFLRQHGFDCHFDSSKYKLGNIIPQSGSGSNTEKERKSEKAIKCCWICTKTEKKICAIRWLRNGKEQEIVHKKDKKTIAFLCEI